MGNIKDAANEYEPNVMNNVSILAEVDVSCELFEEEKTDAKGQTYMVKYIIVDGEKYRMPSTVIRDLKSILEKKPDLKKFSVSRKGTTKEDTRYTVIPL